MSATLASTRAGSSDTTTVRSSPPHDSHERAVPPARVSPPPFVVTCIARGAASMQRTSTDWVRGVSVHNTQRQHTAPNRPSCPIRHPTIHATCVIRPLCTLQCVTRAARACGCGLVRWPRAAAGAAASSDPSQPARARALHDVGAGGRRRSPPRTARGWWHGCGRVPSRPAGGCCASTGVRPAPACSASRPAGRRQAAAGR